VSDVVRPDGLWVSTRFATFLVVVDAEGTITDAPPIVRWAIGKHAADVVWWAYRKDHDPRFVWHLTNGTNVPWGPPPDGTIDLRVPRR